jgi:[ribosomal protein S5]-alanine N-acetyltransferase
MIINFGNSYCIRDFINEDKYSLVKYADNYNVYKNLRDRFPKPYTLHDAEEWIKLNKQTIPPLSFAIANESELIGTIGLELYNDVYRKGCEIGYWLGEPFWGKGITTEAVKCFSNYIFNAYSFNRISAHTFSGNPASAKVLEKAGFSFEGRLRKGVYKEGHFYDVLLYGLLRGDSS